MFRDSVFAGEPDPACLFEVVRGGEGFTEHPSGRRLFQGSGKLCGITVNMNRIGGKLIGKSSVGTRNSAVFKEYIQFFRPVQFEIGVERFRAFIQYDIPVFPVASFVQIFNSGFAAVSFAGRTVAETRTGVMARISRTVFPSSRTKSQFS